MTAVAPSANAASRQLTSSFWEVDASTPLVETTLGDALRARAEKHADIVALVGNTHNGGQERRLTYGELLEEALRVAGALSTVAEPGESVALWAPNVIEWPIFLYGAALAGITLVAINPVFREAELIYVLRDSGAVALVHADISRDYDMASVARAAASECPALREVISLSEVARWQLPAEAPVDESRFGPAATDPFGIALLQYTSGTTGNPKGVLLRHRALYNNAKLTLDAVDAPDGFVGVNPLPMFHTAACVIGTIGPLTKAGTAVLIEKFSGDVVLDAIERENANALFYVPTILAVVLEAAQGRATVPHLDFILGGAASVPAVLLESAERLFGARFHILWGMTELSPVASVTRAVDTPQDKLTSVGRPMHQVEVKVVDIEDRRSVVPVGLEGELCVRGYQQMVEYLGLPQTTAETVDEDGWLHTGDLGTMDERGVVSITGRRKELIIRGGENIAPAEIENHLLKHERVFQAAAVGIPDAKWGEIVAVVLILRGEATSGLREELIRHARSALSPFKVPTAWYTAEALPLTASGKVQKFILRDQVVAGGFSELA